MSENNVNASVTQEEGIERTKDLVVGKTVIAQVTGKVNGRWQSVPVLYGNLCQNYVNGDIKQIREDVYDKYVQEFLESDEGKEYKIPTKEQLRQAKIAIKNQISEYYDREEAKKKAAEEQAKKRAEDEARMKALQSGAEEEPEPEPEEEPEPEIPAEPEPQPEPEPEPEPEPVYEEPEKEPYVEPVQEEPVREYQQPVYEEPAYDEMHDYSGAAAGELRSVKNLQIVMTILMVLSLLANVAFTLFGDRIKERSLASAGVGELVVNGETYEVPLSTLEVDPGETKTVFYAITTTNKDGTVTYEAYPVGEWIINEKGALVPAK